MVGSVGLRSRTTMECEVCPAGTMTGVSTQRDEVIAISKGQAYLKHTGNHKIDGGERGSGC